MSRLTIAAMVRLAVLTAAAVSALSGLPGCAAPPRHGTNDLSWPDVAAELLAMRDADQKVRLQLMEGGPDTAANPALVEQMRSLDRKHTRRLKALVAELGWPRRSQVGDEAAAAAWLLAQHADRDPAFQAHVLDLLAPLVESGEVARPDFALLSDRVRVAQGRPQLYGSQYLSIQIKDVWYYGPSTPIEYPEHLDERRAQMGLGPQAEYDALLRTMYKIPADARPIEELPRRK